MHHYTPTTFTIPTIEGISQKSIEEHLALYQGYVKNWNAITDALAELLKDSAKNAHAISELMRRRSFEFDGMRLHELYFEQLRGGAHPLPEGALASAIDAEFGGVEGFLAELKGVAMMRGPGWALLYTDPVTKALHLGFSGEQHQGHFVTLPVLFALDVWEHAYLLDYGALGKGGYVDALLKAVDWRVASERFAAA